MLISNHIPLLVGVIFTCVVRQYNTNVTLLFERLEMKRCKDFMLRSLCDHSGGHPTILKVNFVDWYLTNVQLMHAKKLWLSS
jgi:hypothetical protein